MLALMQGLAATAALMPPTLVPPALMPPPLMPPSQLQAQVEAFAGKTALVDPRLLLPACARPEMAFALAGRSVMVRCAAPEWRVFVPVGEGGQVDAPAPERFTTAELPALPAVRRGDRVMLEVGGDGFVIGMETVAEADARGGRVALRGLAGGRRLTGFVGDDGRVRLRNLNGVVNGR